MRVNPWKRNMTDLQDTIDSTMLKLREDFLLTVQDEHKPVCETIFETQYYWDTDDRTYNELPTKLVHVAREKQLETVLTQRHIHVVKHREYVTHEWSRDLTYAQRE